MVPCMGTLVSVPAFEIVFIPAAAATHNATAAGRQLKQLKFISPVDHRRAGVAFGQICIFMTVNSLTFENNGAFILRCV